MATPSKIEVHPKYTYNHADDCYVINVKHRVKPLVLKGFKVRALQMAISNAVTPSQTGREICAKYCLSEEDFDEIKKAFGLTRDSFPLTDEELIDSTVEQSADKILEEKRSAVYQAAEKAEWKETQKDADLWRAFQLKELDPFAASLEAWKAPKISKVVALKGKEAKKETLVIGLSDLHFGAASNARYMFQRPDWGTKDTVAAVEKYCQSILAMIEERKSAFAKIIILGMGDLIHSLNGKTARGTELLYDCIKEEQFEYALTSLTSFMGTIASSVACPVEVHSVYGNHNYEAEMALFRALERTFTGNSSIKFCHYSTRPACFVEGSTLLLLDHGADAIERAYVPTGSESKLQLHVQSLLLQVPHLLTGVKEKLFIMGDKHHFEHLEFNDFQFIMLGTMLGADQHAAVNNWKNRPRQSCLIIDENGLKSVHHVYFD